MRLYETTFITDSQLSDSEIDAEIKKVEDVIKSNGGEIVEIQRWGVRRLAYEIKHKRQGFYAHFLYRAPSPVPGLLETAFRVNERVIRFLNVMSDVDLDARRKMQEEGAAASALLEVPLVPEPREEAE